MRIKRCNKCGKVKEIIFKYGEQPAQLVQICNCKDRFENENREN